MATRKPKPKFEFTMTKISENGDGSCNCEVDMNDYTKGKLIEAGVVSLLKQHIAQTYKALPWYKRIFKKKGLPVED